MSDIRYVHFDKIVTLCSNHSYLEVLAHPESENNVGKKSSDKSLLSDDDPKISTSGKTYSSKDIGALPARVDQPKSLSYPLIFACLDIFLAMIECSPSHPFLSTHSNLFYETLLFSRFEH
jgi:hypothetical protein